MNIQPLPASFEGKGEVKGYSFLQIKDAGVGYIYEKTNKASGQVHFEVFKKKIVQKFDWDTKKPVPNEYKIKYPNTVDFGKWAWCVTTLAQAEKYIKKFKDEYKGDTISTQFHETK